MYNTDAGDVRKRLATLSDQERSVLTLRCKGADYKTIADTLHIALPTVKQYMSRIYVKLGLDQLSRTERTKALFETFCPAFEEATLPRVEGEAVEEPVPPSVEKMVDEDENAIILVRPQPTQSVPISSRQEVRKPSGFRTLVIGVVLGICLSTIAAFLFFRFNIATGLPFSQPTPTAPAPANAVAASSIPSSALEIPTQTPVIFQQVVVVTATLPLPTIPAATETLSVTLPFEDTFDLRARPEWEIITGTWRALDGHFTADNNNEWQIAFVGDPNWHNYKIAVTSFSKDFVYPVRIIARASNEGYIAFEYYTAGARWLLVKGGDEKEITSINDRLDWDTTYKIAMEVKEDIYTVFINGLQYSQIQDITFSEGRVGLGFVSPYLTWFDDFRVTVLP